MTERTDVPVAGRHGDDLHHPPGRARVFAELSWRSWVLTTSGGAGIGIAAFLVNAVVLVWSSDEGIGVLLSEALVGAFFGGGVGVVLGVFTGAAMGAAGAMWLVPYPGEASARWTLRVVAVLSIAVASLLLMLWAGSLAGIAGLALGAIIVVPSLVGAWWLSPWVGRWYIDRMRGRDDGVSDAGAT